MLVRAKAMQKLKTTIQQSSWLNNLKRKGSSDCSIKKYFQHHLKLQTDFFDWQKLQQKTNKECWCFDSGFKKFNSMILLQIIGLLDDKFVLIYSFYWSLICIAICSDFFCHKYISYFFQISLLFKNFHPAFLPVCESQWWRWSWFVSWNR